MNIKNLYFKVKKIELKEGGYRIGVLVPLLNDRSSDWFKPTVSFDENKLKAILSDGNSMIVSADSKAIKSTRITDEKIKKIIDEIIEISKENYKNELEYEKSFNNYIKIKSKFKEKETSINNSIQEISNKWAESSGYIDGNTFLTKLNTMIKPISKGYSITLNSIGSIVTGFKLEKVHQLGKWLEDDSYDFIYLEYDDNVCVSEYLDKSKDFQNIKNKYFSNVKNCKVNGATLTSIYDAEGGGDKRSACAYHIIKVAFSKNLEKTTENLSKIADTINATLKLL